MDWAEGEESRMQDEQGERKRDGGRGTVNKFMGKVKSIASSTVRCVLPRAHLFFIFLLPHRPSRHRLAGCAFHPSRDLRERVFFQRPPDGKLG